MIRFKTSYNSSSTLRVLVAFLLMSAIVFSQESKTRYLKDLPFEEIDERICDKINSFEKAESLIVINQLLQSDFTADQHNILKVYKLQALVDSELYDEALLLTEELLQPVSIDPQLEVKVLLERSQLYEILEEMTDSKKDLNRIERLFEEEELVKNELYGKYLYRLSSWFRVNDRRSESIEWAQEAIKFGLENEFNQVGATGYLLMGLNELPTEHTSKRSFFKKGLQLWKESSYEPGIVNMYNLLARSYFNEENYKLAQVYNDSALMIINREKTKYDRPRIYKRRSQIAEALNQLDSALYYQKRYAEEEISALNRSRNIKVREIEFELRKEKTILENIKLETQLSEASRKENYFIVILIIGAIFLLCLGFLIITLASRNKRIKDQNSEIKETNVDLSSNIAEKEFLLKEVNHRVKNNLAFIQSLIAFQLDQSHQLETTKNLESLNNRIHAIAVLHDQFVAANSSVSKKEIKIAPYIQTIANAQVMAYHNHVDLVQKIEDIKVNLETAVPLGILINELITNSMKHSEPLDSSLAIEIALTASDDDLRLEYKDNGKSFKLDPEKETLGLYIIRTMVLQLRGTFERTNSNYSIHLKRR
ncbi:sensor histidine kinase [Nonlabens sp. Hel1_33_55]|uniref:sensor histidine kinase n=1 Tax=Nonlabens sp. Hel1_33_55 TaxID=1336802 RepID=UPI0012FD253F|nr:sensor histidine kinase [Nonlabens sp. Hel1_33_55]